MLSSFSNRAYAGLFSLRFAQVGTTVESIAIKRCAKRRGWLSKCVHLGSVPKALPFHHILYVDGLSLEQDRHTILSSVASCIEQNMPLLLLFTLPKEQGALPEAISKMGYAIKHFHHASVTYVVGFLQQEDCYRFCWPEHLLPMDNTLSFLQKMYLKGFLSQQKKYRSFRYIGWEKAHEENHFLRDEELNLFYIFQELFQASAVNLYSSGIQLSLFKGQTIPT